MTKADDTLAAWLDVELGEFTSGDDAKASKALAKVSASFAPKMLAKALERMLSRREHLLWRESPTFPPHVLESLAAVLPRAKTPVAAFVNALPRKEWPGGLAAASAAFKKDANIDLVPAIARSGVKGAGLVRAAAEVASSPDFVRGLKADSFEEASQAHMAVVAIALLGDAPLDALLGHAVVAPLAAGLLGMAQQAKAKKAVAALEAIVTKSAADSEGARWAAALGLTVPSSDPWDASVVLRPQGPKQTYEPLFELCVYGNQPEDWSVKVFVPKKGQSLQFKGSLESDDLKLGEVASLDTAPTWLAAAAKQYGIAWDFEKPAVSIDVAGGKPKVLAWIRTFA
jgi:hypothetical protein